MYCPKTVERSPNLLMSIRVGRQDHLIGVKWCTKSARSLAERFGEFDIDEPQELTLILLRTSPANSPEPYGWMDMNVHYRSVHVGVVDLTTREKRNEFFELALPPGDNSDILDLIESAYL
jgi:hypothetical protein